jgi:putative ABC transport system ATP-binding protein
MVMAAPGTQRAVLRARNLGKVYRTGEVEVHALRGVDLDLWAGEMAVLLGPSGSGKSTLLNILGGLDSATSGEAWFEDHDLTRQDDRDLTRYRREHVGFVFQFYNLISSLTAFENVALVTEIATRPMEPGAALRLVGHGRARARSDREHSPRARHDHGADHAQRRHRRHG